MIDWIECFIAFYIYIQENNVHQAFDANLKNIFLDMEGLHIHVTWMMSFYVCDNVI